MVVLGIEHRDHRIVDGLRHACKELRVALRSRPGISAMLRATP
jgi:hypothetical protein